MAEQQFIDGVSSTPEQIPPAEPAAKPAKDIPLKTPAFLKGIVLAALSVPYAIYLFWCLFLLTSYPVMGASAMMITIGVLTTVIGALLFLGVGAAGFFRVSGSKAPPDTKLKALIKLGAFVLPGFLLSAITPFLIAAEPPLTISITDPVSTSQLIAPLSISFSVQPAVDVLAERGFKPVQYNWDINADKKVDQQTLSPELTANFDRSGIFTVSVTMKSSDGTVKTASRRFIISQSVFSVTPSPAIKDRPTTFSLAHLYATPEEVLSVAWDFDGDGTFDEEDGGIQTSFTYLATGIYNASAVIQLANNTQSRLEREVVVTEPAPLPFPVTIKTEPEILIGTPDFSVLFSIETAEPNVSVQWHFSDTDTVIDGPSAPHTFTQKGKWPVVATIRTQSGVVAEVITLAKIVDRLELNDLTFDPSGIVVDNTISGEAPLTVSLTPLTQKAFVTFSWEVPRASQVGSTDTQLQALYRDPGAYTVILVARDAEDHVLRLPIAVEVLPPAAKAEFIMDPANGVAFVGDAVSFSASGQSDVPEGDVIQNYNWNFGDGSSDPVGFGSSKHIYKIPGRYDVLLTIQTRRGLELSVSHPVVIRPKPGQLQARILTPNFTVGVGTQVEFKGESSEGSIADYRWDFGDGVKNGGKDMKNIKHVFTDAGVYTVTLTIADISGNTSSSTITITVE